MRKYFFIALALVISGSLKAQSSNNGQIFQLNTITTAVPFLLITPDSEAGAMGDAGCATDINASAIHWNPAKLGFVKNDLEFNVNYTPWLKALVNDISLAYLSGYKKIDKNSSFGFG